MNRAMRTTLVFVLIVLACSLAACGPSAHVGAVEFGIEATATSSPTATSIPTATATPAPTAAPTQTPLPIPTATALPSPTPEPAATEQAKPSRLVNLDETWTQYINYELGFSIRVPKTLVSTYGACKWVETEQDHSFRPETSYVPVQIYEDGNTVYIAGEYYHELGGMTKETSADGGTRTFFGECQAVTNDLDRLRDPENRYQTRWEIVSQEIRDDAELEAFLQDRYGSGCSLGAKAPSAQEGVYDVQVQGDGKDLSETACPLNFGTVVKYAPQENRVVAWDLGQAPTFAADVDYSAVHDQAMVQSFRFLTGAKDSMGIVDVVGWYGSVHSAPAGSGYDDYLSVLPEGVAEVGLTGGSPALEAMIAEMRDKEPPNKYAHFWGTLICGLPDAGGCQLWVTHMRLDGPGPKLNPDPVVGWEGTIVTNSAWAQIDDAFVLAGDYPVQYGIWSEDPALNAQLEGYRNSGTVLRVSGQVLCGVPDANGCQIQVNRLEVAE